MSLPSTRGAISHQAIRVLSLDGGGIRGLSSLIILQDLMERIAVKRHDASLRPSDYFELIIGTGTGGVSALFLGRMRMTADEAIQAYLRMAIMSFKPPPSRFVTRFLKEKAPLKGDAITAVIREIVRNTLGNPEAQLQEPPGNLRPTFCRTAVLAASSSNASDPPYVFRSYPTSLSASTLAIHEVARATVATAGLFPSVSFGTPPMQFVDAGIAGFNNPAEIALQEAARIWPGSQVGCLVSLGTGLQDIINVNRRWSDIMEISGRLIEDCERVHFSISRRRHIECLPYFRFNVTRGLADTGVQEWASGTSYQVAEITGGYTRQPDVDISLNECVSELIGQSNDDVKNGPLLIPESELSFPRRNCLPLLNPPPEIFHGRDEFVELAVSTILREAPARLAILGPGGIGKTSIALHILHSHQIMSKFGDHRRFISCEGVISVSSLVDVFCVAFDIQEVSDRYRVLLSLLVLKYQTKGLFVVLDNFETIWDVADGRREAEQFLSTLVTIPNLTLVVTMRGSEYPFGLRWTLPRLPVVDPLPVEAARTTFLQNGAHEDENLDRLLWTVDYVPLAVTLMARLGQNHSPSQLLERWKEEQVQLLSRPRDEGRLDNMEVSIRFSLKSHRMLSAPGALSLLSGISLLPAGVFDGDLPYIFPRVPNLKHMAGTLVEVGLAYYDKARALRVLSPIRSYMMRCNMPQHESTLLQDLESYYWELSKFGQLSPGKDGYTDAVRKLSNAAPNFEAVIVEALTDGHDLSRVIEAALDWTNFLIWNRPQTFIIEMATQITRRLSKYNTYQAECLFLLGRTHRLIKASDASIEILREAEIAFKSGGNMHKRAVCLWDIGEIQRGHEHYDAAQETLMEALSTFEEIGSLGDCADCFWSLGEIERTHHNLDRARDLFVKSRKLVEAAGGRRAIGDCLWSLGEIERELGEYENSRETITSALEVFERLAMKKRVADCNWTLGLIHCSTEDYDDARAFFIKARDGYKDVCEMDNAGYCEQSLEIIS